MRSEEVELLWRCRDCGYQCWGSSEPELCHCGARGGFTGMSAVDWRRQFPDVDARRVPAPSTIPA